MALQPNESQGTYKEFTGPYNEQMPQLLAEGCTPLTVADLMRRRVEVAGANPDVRAAWMHHYFDTSDAVLHHPTGKIKIVRDAPPLRAVTTKSELCDGALLIDDAVYQSLAGPEFDPEDIIINTALRKREVLESPIWQALAGDDQSLLRSYTDLVFHDGRRLNYDKMMAVHLGAAQAIHCMRPWFVRNILYGSDLCNFDMDNRGNSSGRLVGIAPAVLRTTDASYATLLPQGNRRGTATGRMRRTPTTGK